MASTRIALVTGANQGVGFRVTKELVANDVTVPAGDGGLEDRTAANKGSTASLAEIRTVWEPFAAAAKERPELVFIHTPSIASPGPVTLVQRVPISDGRPAGR